MLKMNLANLQLFAHKKGGGSTSNGRDSQAKRLGAKAADGQTVTGGSILYRQRGTHIYPGVNVGRGGDDTLFAKVESISTAELEKRLKTNIKLLDVRTPSEYNRGHIKGALNIPLGQIDRYSQSKEEKLYVICHSGVRSRLAAKKLKKKGYDVVNVSGGMMSWKGDVV